MPKRDLIVKVLSTSIFGVILYHIYKHKKQSKSESECKTINNDMMLKHDTDHYNGVRCNNMDALPKTLDLFKQKLIYSLNIWRKEGKRGAWIKLPMKYAHYLPFCIENGYKVHHGNEGYIMVSQWLPTNESNMIPVYGSSYCGAHCYIVNKNKEIIVIKEHYGRKNWKIPGGAVDFGEYFSDACVREAKEETGLDCQFIGVFGVRHLLNFRFGNTCDVSFICILRPIDMNQKLNPIHKNEIKDIKWMNINDYLNNEKHLFVGNEIENINALLYSIDWLINNWDNNILDGNIYRQSGLLRFFKQTHPYRRNAKIALYHQ